MERTEQEVAESGMVLADLRVAWPMLSVEERLDSLKLVPEEEAEDFFLGLSRRDQYELLMELPSLLRRTWLRVLPLDDAADVIQTAPVEQRGGLLQLLDDVSRKEVIALLAYAEDEAGGLMNPRYARLRPEMTVDAALLYLRRQAQQPHTKIFYAYVLDGEQKLRGVLSFRQLLSAPRESRVDEVMRTDVVTVGEETDQEAIAPLFTQHELMALPIVDPEGRMKGIITADDIVDVVQEEATEDIQKLAGVQVLDAPYMTVRFPEMIRKRAVWLVVLFVGELLTAVALDEFQADLQKAVVLALFMPLIISTGGNSGSQASTLVIRALALKEFGLKDWWRVVRREIGIGAVLGTCLATLGIVFILLGNVLGFGVGEHYMRLSLAVAISLLCVAIYGTFVGSVLPFLLRAARLDPATACSPFIATLCDVTGLVIYFSVAQLLLSGTLLKHS